MVSSPLALRNSVFFLSYSKSLSYFDRAISTFFLSSELPFSLGFFYSSFVLNRLHIVSFGLLYIAALELVLIRLFLLDFPTSFSFGTRFTSKVCLNYLKFSLQEKNFISNSIKTLQKFFLKYDSNLSGYRIVVDGRYGRQQRSAKFVVTKGCLKLTSLRQSIDYSDDFVILKHGVCSLRIWLSRFRQLDLSKRLYLSNFYKWF